MSRPVLTASAWAICQRAHTWPAKDCEKDRDALPLHAAVSRRTDVALNQPLRVLLPVSRTPGPPPMSAAKDWVRFAKRPAGSHRFCLGDLRRRTPGPPPLSSMNSMPALWHLFGPSDSFREPHTHTAAVLRYELDCGLRSEIPWFQDLDAPALQGGSKRRFDRGGENWFRFAKSGAAVLIALADLEGAHPVHYRSRRCTRRRRP